jgi:hypothetical protein
LFKAIGKAAAAVSPELDHPSKLNLVNFARGLVWVSEHVKAKNDLGDGERALQTSTSCSLRLVACSATLFAERP